jgi:hypothetical protein
VSAAHTVCRPGRPDSSNQASGIKSEIPFVLLTKGNSGCAPPDRIDVELDRSVAERDAFEYRIAAVQSHQAVIKTQLPEELRVLLVCQWSAVMAIVIGSAPWVIGSADRKHTQSAILFRASLLTSAFMTPAYGPGTPFDELKVTRRTGVLRGGPGGLRVGSWNRDMPERAMGVLVADDERPARRRLLDLLRRESGITAVWEATDGQVAVDLIHSCQPDVVVVPRPLINGPPLERIVISRSFSKVVNADG